MKRKLKQSGLSMIETAVVLATVAALAVLSVPAIRAFTDSLGSPGSVKAMIGAGLSSARAIAAKEQRYAGIRFQEDINGDQYMIFIVHDIETDYANGFRVVKGCKPIKLPETLGVTEFIVDDIDIDTPDKFTDKTTFSIVFSPSGKLIIHEVIVRNKDGSTGETSTDTIFNTPDNMTSGYAMFTQDAFDSAVLVQELSQRGFVIYDKAEFNKVNISFRWSQYLYTLEMIYINPYTGTIISTNR